MGRRRTRRASCDSAAGAALTPPAFAWGDRTSPRRTPENKLGRGTGPDSAVLTGLAVPRSVLLPHEPARLMLEPVERARQNRALLVPDNLLVVQEPDAQEAIQDLACE